MPGGRDFSTLGSHGFSRLKKEGAMAARLTDKQKKKIIADYVELGSYSAVARKHKISDKTVKSVVLSDPEFTRKSEDKKEENCVDNAIILCYNVIVDTL